MLSARRDIRRGGGGGGGSQARGGRGDAPMQHQGHQPLLAPPADLCTCTGGTVLLLPACAAASAASAAVSRVREKGDASTIMSATAPLASASAPASRALQARCHGMAARLWPGALRPRGAAPGARCAAQGAGADNGNVDQGPCTIHAQSAPAHPAAVACSRPLGARLYSSFTPFSCEHPRPDQSCTAVRSWAERLTSELTISCASLALLLPCRRILHTMKLAQRLLLGHGTQGKARSAHQKQL